MWNNTWNFESDDLYQVYTLQRHYHHFLVILATFKVHMPLLPYFPQKLAKIRQFE